MRRHLHAAASRIPFVAGGGAGWIPTDRANLTCWIDFSDLSKLFQVHDGTTAVTAHGDNIGQMQDKSGNGEHFDSNHTFNGWASRPTLDITSSVYSGVWINGGADPTYVLSETAIDVFPSKRGTIGIAYRQDTVATLTNLLGEDTSFDYYTSRTGAKNKFYDLSSQKLSANYTPSGWVSEVLVRDANTNLILRVNGTEENITIADLTSASNIMGLGNQNGAQTSNLGGKIAQLVIYSVASDATERATLDTFLRGKVGLP